MNRFGLAWTSLALALALHVTDEARNDFLSVYNPTVLAIRSKLPWLPLPTFTFKTWITGLTLGILLLLALAPFAFRRSRWLIPPAFILGVLMTLNGLGHISGSIYTGSWMPGVYSSPLLIAAAVWLLIETRRA
jgi:putative copper export protein